MLAFPSLPTGLNPCRNDVPNNKQRHTCNLPHTITASTDPRKPEEVPYEQHTRVPACLPFPGIHRTVEHATTDIVSRPPTIDAARRGLALSPDPSTSA